MGAGGQFAGAGAALRPPGAAVAQSADRPLHRRLRCRRRGGLRRLLRGGAGAGALRLRAAAAGAGGTAVLAELGGVGHVAGAQPPRRPAPVEGDGRGLLPHRGHPQSAAEAAAAAAHPAEGGQAPAEPVPPRGHLPPQAPPGQALRGRRAGPELHPEPAGPAAGERDRAGPPRHPRCRLRPRRAPLPPLSPTDVPWGPPGPPTPTVPTPLNMQMKCHMPRPRGVAQRGGCPLVVGQTRCPPPAAACPTAAAASPITCPITCPTAASPITCPITCPITYQPHGGESLGGQPRPHAPPCQRRPLKNKALLLFS